MKKFLILALILGGFILWLDNSEIKPEIEEVRKEIEHEKIQ